MNWKCFSSNFNIRDVFPQPLSLNMHNAVSFIPIAEECNGNISELDVKKSKIILSRLSSFPIKYILLLSYE